MIDRPRVEDLLSKLSEAGFGEKLRLAGSGDLPRIFRAVLRELDTKVLPRVVKFGSADGPLFEVEAANRRVISYGPVGKKGVAFDPEEDSEARAFHEFLEEHLAGVTALYATSETPENPIEASGSGMSVSAIADAWDTALSPAGLGVPGDAVDSLMSMAADLVSAWCIEADDESEAFGEPDATSMLEELAASDRAADLFSVTAGEEPWQFVAVSGTTSQDLATAFARIGDVRVMIALPPENLGSVAEIWHQIMAH